MEKADWEKIDEAKRAALQVLRHNSIGPFEGLPRTAGWGYPEPYTRDLLISILGIVVSDDQDLMQSMRLVLETLATHQSFYGHIPSMVHEKSNLGASDTTPLFLLATAIFRVSTRENDFLHEAVQRGINWMEYQSPSDQD